MSVTDDHSYFSRFLLKFVEIIAAGMATAEMTYAGRIHRVALPATALHTVADNAMQCPRRSRCGKMKA